MDANKILKDREERFNLINYYIKDYQVVSLKANIPGIDKNINYAYILTNLFNNLLLNKLKPIKTIYKVGCDGPCYIYLFNKNKILKHELEKIENTSLGRFIDIDCFYDCYISKHRKTPRKCFICDKEAFVCQREQNHTISELLDFLKTNVDNYLIEFIQKTIKESALEELNLTKKFGLVSPISDGSHKDMNYKMMANSIDVITPYLTKMFIKGYTLNISLTELFKIVRLIGVEADKAMFIATNNVNTYQGLIFNLGLMVTSLGRVLSHNLNPNKLWINCSEMVSELPNKKGAILEAYNKYDSVYHILKKYDLISDESKRYALMDLIINVDDTIFKKRCSDELVRQEVIMQFKKALKLKDSQLINQINEYCENNNYSFGGCADLLVVAIFLKKISILFHDL